MPGYKHPCRFCGKLVDANSAYCPFCARPHPHHAVCPWCVAPIEAGWQVCGKCGKALVVPCGKCGSPVGPDTDVCEKCGTILRYRCPTCASVVPRGDRTCGRCGADLRAFWKSKGVR